MPSYAYGKFSELVENLFCDMRPARTRLLENYHLIFVIAPSDFKTEGPRTEWSRVQKSLKDKITNFGSERIPQERLTVQNSTLEGALRTIWSIYGELHQDG